MTTPLNRSDRRRAGLIVGGAAALSALGVTAIVFTATNAAFTATTSNDGNSFEAATITLTDDDGGSAMFAVTDMLPGDTVTDCIEVTYTGAPVGAQLDGLNLYGTVAGTLANDLNVTVERSAAGGSCAAFASAATVFASTLDTLGTDYATGSAGLTPSASGEVVAYRFTVELDAATPSSEQGATASVDFTWEVQTA